jgi:hypothetical protein
MLFFIFFSPYVKTSCVVFCVIHSPASSDFPPLAPFYRSHSTGSLTPADIPSASSRLLSASKEEKTFSINRECDFPTLATAAAVVEQPARMHKSKSATALPQAISPSSDLLKAHHTTLAALAGPVVSSAPPPSAAASSPALAPAITAGPEPLPLTKQTHKKKPSFSDKVSFSEIAATEKAASNKDKFQQTMANSRAELQRFKSLVPSKPVHPSLANRVLTCGLTLFPPFRFFPFVIFCWPTDWSPTGKTNHPT